MKFNRNSLEVLSNFLLEFPADKFNNNDIEYQEVYRIPAHISQTPIENLPTEFRYDALAVFAIMADMTEVDISWEDLENELFGYEDGDDDVWWFISGTDADLTPIQISRRISYMLEHGVPKDYDNFEDWYD